MCLKSDRKGAGKWAFPVLLRVGTEVAIGDGDRKEQLKNMKSDMIANGSVFTDFTLVSYDVDSGRMLIKK